jgi:hypothetical protein
LEPTIIANQPAVTILIRLATERECPQQVIQRNACPLSGADIVALDQASHRSLSLDWVERDYFGARQTALTSRILLR